MPTLHPDQRSTTRQERWEKETEYFDSVEYDVAPLSKVTIDRYVSCRRPWLSAEYPFWAMGDVRGKRILDIGCGDGTRSILLALKGARVVGVDLTPRAVEVAKQRAVAHGVEQSAEFICHPLEEFNPEEKFDIIVGWNILHHLIPELAEFLENARRFGKADCLYLFYEPVNLSPLLRRVRLTLPVPVAGTPDERPLEEPELAVVRGSFAKVEIVYFGFFVRLFSRFVLANGNYEASPRLRRIGHETLGRLDQLLLRTLGCKAISSTATILCRP